MKENSLFTPVGACDVVKHTKYVLRFEELRDCIFTIFGMACAESENNNDDSGTSNLRKAMYLFEYGYLVGRYDAEEGK